MSDYQKKVVIVTKATSETLQLYSTFEGLAYGEIIHHSITVGCSLHDNEYSSILVDNIPWNPPIPAKFDQFDSDNYDVAIHSEQLIRWGVLALQLELDMTETLDWCIKCWEQVYAQRRRKVICVLPSGRRVPANFLSIAR